MAGLLFPAFYFYNTPYIADYLLVLLCSLPAFVGGLVEDFTKKAGVKTRLVLTMLSGGMGVFLPGASINRIDIPFIDNYLLSLFPISLAFTMFAVGGVANSINIIDGFNGIAGGVSLIILLALGYVSFLVEDPFLMILSFIVCFSILGFLLWNYPAGKIFLGDGGVYLLGFLIAEISVLLVNRNQEVSPWFPMLLVTYPVTETLFSIYRRKYLRGISPGVPDGVHLHTLIYKRLVRWGIDSEDARYKTIRNSLTAPYLWGLTLLTALPAIAFWRNTLILIAFLVAFVLLYIWLYWKIVRFKPPRCLIIK
ncbi:MAG: glycosyltransferase [Aquificaceae bacterium]|nr:glycosyltransferase [Aquificaceae bacterium]